MLVLFLLARLIPDLPRHRLRRSLLLFPLLTALVAVHQFAASFSGHPWYRIIALMSELLIVLMAINLAAVSIFDVFLRIAKLRYPDILHDLAVGAAYLLAIVWLMHRSGVNLASIVATSAVVTAVIGLSLQSTLGNIIGGLALQVDDSIHEGDWIELENKSQGQVKKIRWRHTVLETRDWDTLVVPNSLLLNQIIKVLGKREGQPTQHRMWVYFNVDFRYSPAEVIRCVDTALQAAPIAGVANAPSPHTICFDFAKERRDSFAYYAVRYWLTDIARDDPTSSAVRERVYAALKRAQIPLAMPAAALFTSHEGSKRRERKHKRQVDRCLAALKQVELFSSLSEEELTGLASAAKQTPFASGEVITRQGAHAHWLYVLAQGKVEVRVKQDGAERHVAHLQAPSFFGEMALMTGAAREATVVATTDVLCLRVDHDDFSELLKRRPQIATEISEILADRRVALNAALEGIAAKRGENVQRERNRILSSIREIFSLSD